MVLGLTRRRMVGALIAIVIATGIGGAVALRAAKKAQDDAKAPPVSLQFAPADLAYVRAVRLARWLPVSGTLQPIRQAVVKARVTGDVRQITVREGETVREGQLLVRIDTTDLDSKLIDRIGALESARAQLALAEKTRAMNVRLMNDKFISQNAFDSADAGRESSSLSAWAFAAVPGVRSASKSNGTERRDARGPQRSCART